MWVLLDRKVRFTFLVAFVLIIAVIYAVIAFQTKISSNSEGVIALRILGSIFSAIGTATFLITVFGGRQFLWRVSLRLLPGVKAFLKFPDVNGVWLGRRHSSYLEDKARSEGSDPPPPEPMQLKIRQSWLRVQVETVSSDGRTISQSVNALPEIWQNSPLIWSVYRAIVEQPSSTESPNHNGCAQLQIREESEGIRIFGTYFSDRGIVHHKPSAGTFTLWRISTDPDHKISPTEIEKFLSNTPTLAEAA
jgi:SMODS-associating 2TM, beta-strand rich effector domain